jgi:acetolactate synthase-1/2/3 large subunit
MRNVTAIANEVQASIGVSSQSTAQLLVRSLVNQGVKHILGIPGGKIMRVFDVLDDEGPELIVCRHEQNAAFIAAAVGRLTGRPGVCLVTSGPGVANVTTALATATTEGDPVVAIGGAVPLSDALKQTHQAMDSVSLMRAVTKYSVEVRTPGAAGEVVANAFRAATTPRRGAAFISLPMDVADAPANVQAPAMLPVPPLGPAPESSVQVAAAAIAKAKCPVVLLGMGASEPRATAAVRSLLAHHALPVVGTFQGAGTVSRALLPLFFGRVGLFRNQPGDKLLAKADVVLTVGYDPVEYDPGSWNVGGKRSIIHLDDSPCQIDTHYEPDIELRGDIAGTLGVLQDIFEALPATLDGALAEIQQEWRLLDQPPTGATGGSVHPLVFVQSLRKHVDDDTVVTVDIGSNYIWMARHFYSFEPRQLLFSNGQQTLGVALPWAIGASLVHPTKKIVGVAGDGGFLFTSMELETAVRIKANITMFILRDGSYNMVAFAQQRKYGRTSGVNFAEPDLVKYAESFGALGLRVSTPDQLDQVMRRALDASGPVIVDVPVDYSKNGELSARILSDALN